MKVHELIAHLEAKPRNATIYVKTTDPEIGTPILQAVEGIYPAQSPDFGMAIIIEMEA